VLFSLANGAAHAFGIRRCQCEGGFDATQHSWLWRGLGLAALNAWLWAAVFHCRDVYWTQCADYFSALLLLVVGSLVAAVMLLDAVFGRVGRRTLALLGAACAVGVAAHVRRMLRFFDFGQHMAVCVIIGVVQMCAWICWWRLERRRRRHAWRAPAVSVALHITLALELNDFPPIGGVFDAHALWHVSTVPLAFLYWRCFVLPELRWVRVHAGSCGDEDSACETNR